MITHKEEDVSFGIGAVEQAMRSQTGIPGRAVRMTPGQAIGILSAAMRSGMPAEKIDQMINRQFDHSAAMLRRLLEMYQGNDWDLHLWYLLPNGKYKLCTALCRPDYRGWRYDPSCVDEEF